MKIAERIRQEREKRGWSQEQLAEMIGVDRTTINKYETGASRPTRKIKELSALLGISAEEFVGVEISLKADTQRTAASDRLLFDEREREHIKKYRAMTDEHREAVDAQIDFFYKKDAEARVKSGSVQAGRNFTG